jgi:hypothetical protein
VRTIIKVIWDVIEQHALPQTGWDGGIGDGTEMHDRRSHGLSISMLVIDQAAGETAQWLMVKSEG